MTPTTYQTPEIRDSNDNIIKQGSFGKNTALANSTNDGWIDYVANDLEFLYGLAKDEVVPVSELPSAGDTNKTYLLTTTGVCYRWSGTEWVAVSSSEAVSRADSAAYLAEQWATKTSGTVDGMEYSAKYYAEQAQDTADDLSESLEQIATNTTNIEENAENIAQNTTDIDIADKRISNIEKLLQGNLYDYQTDSSFAYTKTVLAGAMPYASLDSVGGKTVVWNQLLNAGTISIATTNTAEKAVGTFSGVSSHKYLFLWNQDATLTSNTRNTMLVRDSQNVAIYESSSTNHNLSAGQYGWLISPTTLTSGTWNINYWGHSPNVAYNITNVVCFDLTLMFGAGNEPTTVEEFTAQFPAQWYAFNNGTLLSAGVTEVVSAGRNLWNLENRTRGDAGESSNTTPRSWNVSEYYYSFTRNNYYYKNVGTFASVTDGFEFTPAYNYTGILLPFKANAGETYTLTCNYSGAGFEVGYAYYDNNGNFLSFNSPSNALSAPKSKSSCTTPANTYWVAVVMIGNANTQFTVTNIQFEKSATATEYVPYRQPISYPIPAEVQALEGYGWSVQLYINNVYSGDVYNQIDFENKKYIQNVGKVTLNGSESWTWDTNNALAYTIIPNGFIVNTATQHNTYVMSSNPSITSTSWGGRSMYTYAMGMYYGQTRLFCKSENFTSADDVKTYFTNNPTDVNYVLQTPIETDISQYLTDDNLISVEAGGTLTFPNSNGTDYQIPVPSSETYMVDLQASL